jgi:hypothetical protein
VSLSRQQATASTTSPFGITVWIVASSRQKAVAADVRVQRLQPQGSQLNPAKPSPAWEARLRRFFEEMIWRTFKMKVK